MVEKRNIKERKKTYAEDIVSIGDTVHRRRVNLILGLDLIGNLGRRLVGSRREQTTLKKTAGNVTRGLGLLSRLGGNLLADLRAVEEVAVHRRRLELLVDLLDELRVGLEGGLLANEGRVGLVGHLDDTRLDFLDWAALVTESDGDCLA